MTKRKKADIKNFYGGNLWKRPFTTTSSGFACW